MSSSAVLTVRFAAPVPARCRTLETRSGTIRWALLDDTLIVQPEREIAVSDRAHVEHLVRTVMRSSGLARRYHVFTMDSRALTEGFAPPAVDPGARDVES
ncbi:MAG: hypothetical protein ACOC1U_06940 [Spirochaetota bacterium]